MTAEVFAAEVLLQAEAFLPLVHSAARARALRLAIVRLERCLPDHVPPDARKVLEQMQLYNANCMSHVLGIGSADHVIGENGSTERRWG